LKISNAAVLVPLMVPLVACFVPLQNQANLMDEFRAG